MRGPFALSRRSLAAATLVAIASGAAPCFAQSSDQSAYLELEWMRVKQDKVAEFGQLMGRVADANRRGKGDTWVAYMDMYGRDNLVWLASGRSSLSEVDPAMNKFAGSVKEFMGWSLDRFFAEASKTIETSGTQLWRHRFDLSWNVKDPSDWEAQLAKSRCVAVITIHVKPGHMVDTEKQIKMVSDAVSSSETKTSGLVSQLLMGGDPGMFVVRVPLASVADVAQMVSARKALGEEGYKSYSEMAAQDYASIDYTLKRMLPEWSSPPASFVAANPAMWKIRPVSPARPKAPASDSKSATSGGQ